MVGKQQRGAVDVKRKLRRGDGRWLDVVLVSCGCMYVLQHESEEHSSERPWSRCAVAIGNFDGVHVGHQALLSACRTAAMAMSAAAVVVTFDPHPTALLAPSVAPLLLSSLERRIEMFADARMDGVVVIAFNEAMAAMSASAFVQMLAERYSASYLVVGHDFSYGCKRSGSALTLPMHAGTYGASAEILPAVRSNGVIASSSAIRSALGGGNVALANRLLGRPYDIDGVVIHGAKRGREIGVPTANIKPDVPLLIMPGIYAVRLRSQHDPGWLDAVASFGTNPTFVDGPALSFEVHVLDWSGDLYDQHVRVQIVKRLRGEVKYAGIDPLLAQIKIDIEQARIALASGE
jgi:riboflavin kinase / FMN adenylyltransferase